MNKRSSDDHSADDNLVEVRALDNNSSYSSVVGRTITREPEIVTPTAEELSCWILY